MGHALQYAKHLRTSVIEPVILGDSTAVLDIPPTGKGDPRPVKYIYSHLLGMKLFPYRDPITGNITKVTTEDGDSFTEEDLTAFRAVRDAFGIEEMVKVIQEKKTVPLEDSQPKTINTDGK